MDIMTIKKNQEKFSGNKPLMESVNDYYPDKYMIKYNKFETPKEFDLYYAIKGERLPEKEYNIVFGIRATPEEFGKFDFLWCPDGPAFVVHKRVLDKFNELCPNDIQALPVSIKNLDVKIPKFEDRSFYLINILNIRDVFDKSYVISEGRMVPKLSKQVFNDNCMKSSLLARDNQFHSSLFFDPSLAKHFIKSKGIQFLTDEEATLIGGHPNDLWFYLNQYYSQTMINLGIYNEFYDKLKYESESDILKLITKYSNEIFLNYCPNCGNLKKTPKARQCLKCMKFIDPI